MTIQDIKNDLLEVSIIFKKLPCLGYYQPDLNEILILKELNLDDRVYTLIHELIHKHHPEYEENLVEGLTIQTYERLDDSTLGYLEFICEK